LFTRTSSYADRLAPLLRLSEGIDTMTKRPKQQPETRPEKSRTWIIESGTRGTYVGGDYAHCSANWPLFTWSPDPRTAGAVASAQLLFHCADLLPAQMRYEFSIPTNADKVPTGPDWLHEVKYDGYRMMVIPRATLSSWRRR
jgi:hypothetical protein